MLSSHDTGGSVVPNQSCPHVFSSFKKKSLLGLLHNSLKQPCHSCGSSKENWLCLCCGIALCSRYVQGHMEEHWMESLCSSSNEPANQHCLALSYADLSVWCYGCNSYVKHERLQTLLVKAESVKFNEPERTELSRNCIEKFHTGLFYCDTVDDNGDTKLTIKNIRERFDGTFLTASLQVVTDKGGGETYREGLCTYIDLLYRDETEDGDYTIERGIIIVGATRPSSLPTGALPTPPHPSTSNNNITYNISDFNVIIDNEITDGRTPVRTLNVPAVSPSLGEAIDRAGRLYGVKTALIINLTEEVPDGEIIFGDEAEGEEKGVVSMSMSLTTAHVVSTQHKNQSDSSSASHNKHSTVSTVKSDGIEGIINNEKGTSECITKGTFEGVTNKENWTASSHINEENRELKLSDYDKVVNLLDTCHPDLLFINFKSFPPSLPSVTPWFTIPHIPINENPYVLSTNTSQIEETNVIQMATDVIDFFLRITSAQNNDKNNSNKSIPTMNNSTCKVIFTLHTPLSPALSERTNESLSETELDLFEACVKTILHWKKL